MFVGKVHREIAVYVITGFIAIKKLGIHTGVFQLVFNLTYLNHEITPFLAVK